MIKYSIRLSTAAKKDLTEIKEYITASFSDATLGNKILATIKKRIMRLTIFPEGSPRSSLASNVRMTSVLHYSIFYNVRKKIKEVYILRIIYSRRNIGQADLDFTD